MGATPPPEADAPAGSDAHAAAPLERASDASRRSTPASWRLETPTTPMHVGALLAARWRARSSTQAAGFAWPTSSAEIEARLSRCPRLRQRLAPVPCGAARPVGRTTRTSTSPNHVRACALSASRYRAQLDQLCCELQMEVLDRTRPLWEMWFVGRAGRRVGRARLQGAPRRRRRRVRGRDLRAAARSPDTGHPVSGRRPSRDHQAGTPARLAGLGRPRGRRAHGRAVGSAGLGVLLRPGPAWPPAAALGAPASDGRRSLREPRSTGPWGAAVARLGRARPRPRSSRSAGHDGRP